MLKLLAFIASLAFSASASATITVTGISGVSSYNSNIASATVFGGTSGYSDLTNSAPSCRIMDGVNACDSCLSAVCQDSSAAPQSLSPLCACNRSRIYDNLTLTVAADQSNHVPMNFRMMAPGGVGTGTEILASSPYNTNSFSLNWSQICGLISGGLSTGTCEGVNGSIVLTLYADMDNSQTFTAGDEAFQITVRVVSPSPLDENVFGLGAMEGIGAFTMMPGDGKAFIRNVLTATSFPSLSYGVETQAIRVFISDKDLSMANSSQAMMSVDLPLNVRNGTIPDEIIDLKNGKLYFFRVALVDQAGNVVQHFPDMTATQSAHPECFGPKANESCPYAARPMKIK